MLEDTQYGNGLALYCKQSFFVCTGTLILYPFHAYAVYTVPRAANSFGDLLGLGPLWVRF